MIYAMKNQDKNNSITFFGKETELWNVQTTDIVMYFVVVLCFG